MNAARPHFVTLRRAGAAAALSVGALLSGCASSGTTTAAVEPSPVAAEAARAAAAPGPYPTFQDIPAKPGDMRPARQFGQAAATLRTAREDLTRATAPETWTLGSTEAFAETAQRRAGPERAAGATTDTEAFAQDLRDRATPPPPIAR